MSPEEMAAEIADLRRRVEQLERPVAVDRPLSLEEQRRLKLAARAAAAKEE